MSGDTVAMNLQTNAIVDAGAVFTWLSSSPDQAGVIERVVGPGTMIDGRQVVTAAGGRNMLSGSRLALRVGLSDGTQAIVIADRVEPCRADFNGDGNRDPDDLADFITCFFLDVQFPGVCPAADFNGDGFRDPDDLADFITTFFLGC